MQLAFNDQARHFVTFVQQTAEGVIEKLSRRLQGADPDDVARTTEHYVPGDARELKITVERERPTGVNALPWPLILFMAAQTGLGIWWAATTTANLSNLNTTVLYRMDQSDKNITTVKSEIENRIEAMRREFENKVDVNNAYVNKLANSLGQHGITMPERQQ
jgi:hypothetical protein